LVSQEEHTEAGKNNPYTLPITLLIIGLLLAGGGTALVENAVIQVLVGLVALAMILVASLLAVRRMQHDPNLNE